MLTKEDLDFILESLRYTQLKFEEYDRYPDYEYKQKRLKDVADVISKVNKLKEDL